MSDNRIVVNPPCPQCDGRKWHWSWCGEIVVEVEYFDKYDPIAKESADKKSK